MSETFNDPSRKNIPYLAELSKQGTVFTQFYNKGTTRTMEGYAAILTGTYYDEVTKETRIKNPSFFQVFIDQKSLPLAKAQAVLSKKKLKIFADAGYPDYLPSRFYAWKDISDAETFNRAIKVLEEDSPSLFLVGFRQPDKVCHSRSFQECVGQIRETDKRIAQLWEAIQKMPFYKDKTTLIVTNDHGRHLDGVEDGFSNHGCGCAGCRNIFLLVVGPDIKKGYESHQVGELIDIAPTIAELLNFDFPSAKGRVLQEMIMDEK